MDATSPIQRRQPSHGGTLFSNILDEAMRPAFSAYYLLIGIASLAASTMAGLLWGVGGASATFAAEIALSGLALLLLVLGRSLLPIGTLRQADGPRPQ